MLNRISYILGETFASFRRQITLTVAAIITAAISLLIFGLTLLIQDSFNNVLHQWQDGVEMIVFVQPGTPDDQRQFIQSQLEEQRVDGGLIERFEYCDVQCSLEDVRVVLAGDPAARDRLNETNTPTQFKIAPTEEANINLLKQLKQSYQSLPGVHSVNLAEEQIELIERLQGFVATYTNALWISLLFAAGLLIWNTIRTAMFARRREIEVMKLVGATDWFIRLPFMLEGFIQGILGGSVAVVAMIFINSRWAANVQELPEGSGMSALVISQGYDLRVALYMLLFGAFVGTVGSGIAASRFLDV